MVPLTVPPIWDYIHSKWTGGINGQLPRRAEGGW